MEEIRIKAIFDDSDVDTGAANVVTKLGQVSDAYDDMGASAADAFGRTSAELAKNEEFVKKNANSLFKWEQAIEQSTVAQDKKTKSLRGFVSELQDRFNKTIDKTLEKLTAYRKRKEESIKALQQERAALLSGDAVLAKRPSRYAQIRDAIKGNIAVLFQEARELDGVTENTRKYGAVWGTVLNLIGTGFPKAAKAITAASRIIKIALISTGIGAIVVAVGLLISVIAKLGAAAKNSTSGLSLFERVVNTVKAAVQVSIGIIKQFADGIQQVVEGAKTFSQVLQQTGKNVQDFTQRTIATAAAMNRAAEATKAAEAAMQNYSVRVSQNQDTLNKLREATADSNKTLGARTAALRQAAAIETELENVRKKAADGFLASAALELQAARASGTGIEAAQKKLIEAQIETRGIEADIAARRRADARELQELQRENLETLRNFRKEYQGLLDDLEQRVDQAGLNLLPEAERIREEGRLAIEEIDRFVIEFKKQIDDLRKAGFKDAVLPADFEAQVEILKQAVDRQVEEAYKELSDKYKKETKKLLVDQVAVLQIGLGEFQPVLKRGIPTIFEKKALDEQLANFKAFKAATIKEAEPLKTIFEAVKEKILVALNITEEQAQVAFIGISTAVQNFAALGNIIEEAQREQNQRVIDGLNRRIDATQEAYERELELQQQGYRNSADLYKEQLETLQKQRDEAEKVALEREKKAANARLAITAAQQISEYVLAVVRIFSEGQKLGPIAGIAVALGGIAILAATVAQARANAQKFSTPDQFREGGPVTDGYISGASHASGGRKIEVEGGEYVVRKEHARPALSLLERINSGEFKGIDFDKMLSRRGADLAPALQKAQTDRDVIVNLQSSIDYGLIEDAYRRAASDTAQTVINYLQTRPVVKLDAQGNEVREWKEGNKTRRQRVSKTKATT